jgi:quercetin dioxygenase-like cupin family protein
MKSLLVTAMVGGLVGGAAAPPSTQDQIQIVPQTARTASPGASNLFSGHALVEQLFGARDQSRVTGGIVTFDPGARSAWHTHPVGQILIVMKGSGLVQQWGSPPQSMKAGDVVWIAANVKHWHGASAKSSVTHIAIQEGIDGKVVDWLEAVTDEQYAASQVH